ncbi:sigma 54-interacting transcriptional regulator [Vagococcus fluvialis]|uniref:sigma 54-interacting transcriptional regulator n=1 Tax=Vagococcus fluvialis TaxID=2738 RepID=UPI003D12F72D
MKKNIEKYLDNQTAFFNLDELSDIFTTNGLANVFKVKRNTISHYLNQLNEEGVLVKINSRPVYYFHKEAFSQQFFPLKKSYYSSVSEIKEERPLFEKKEDLFSLLIGHDKSLSRSVEQIKIALNYPDNGLPVLITGESGTGKSFIINLIHKYCIDNELIDESAPLVTLNCAQYANNPELLTSHLFGHKKGAFTGADEDRIGTFEQANNGILFLDEVHRLNSEGQEKLFTFLDQGVIYPMGETGKPIPIKTRIFFATTEGLESSFLTTFIRRIPIQIELPSLELRNKNERLELIYSFLIDEQRRIEKDVLVSGQVISLFTNGTFKGNIGELKDSIKVTVAKAFSEQRTEKSLNIKVQHIPEKLLKRSATISGPIQKEVFISNKSSLKQLIIRNNPKEERILVSFERMLTEFQRKNKIVSDCEDSLKQEVDHLFDLLLFETDRQDNHEMLIYLTQYIRETFKQMESAYQINFNGNSVYAISYYLYQRGNIRWFPEDPEINMLIKLFEEQIASSFPTSYYYVNRILDLCQPKLDLEILPMDKIFLTIYLKRAEWTKKKGIPKAVIVAHGYATASSIANVANRLLGKDIYESFDMSLDVTPQKIAEEIISYSERNDISNGLVILVDMGSLKEIYEYFPKQITAPVVIMNNVTTPIAISMGENLQKIKSLNEMIEKTMTETKLEYEIIYPETNKTKVILTTCITGIGTATQISHMLEKSLPPHEVLKIVPCEFDRLNRKKSEQSIFLMYDVLGVIGTINPNIEGIPYLSLEELIAGDEKKEITKWLEDSLTLKESEEFNNNIIRNFSLEKVIDSVTILDTEKVMEEIEVFMRNLESQADIKIGNAQKLALFVHISCLIERLIRNMPIEIYNDYDKLVECQRKMLNDIKGAFSVVEDHYSVSIPNSEIAYIYDILFGKTEYKRIDEEF